MTSKEFWKSVAASWAIREDDESVEEIVGKARFGSAGSSIHDDLEGADDELD